MKLRSLITAGAAFLSLASIASAQDKATLDLLLSKGIITADDAASVAKSAVEVKAKDKAVKSVTLTGRIQAQYMGAETTAGDYSASKNQMYLRRLYLGMAADLGAGWKGSIVMNFADDSAAIDSATISKKLSSLDGTLSVGYQKVNFGYEENTSSSKLMTIERSTATRYFNEGGSAGSGKKLGFGAKHMGITWKGDIEAIDGLSYAAAFTNSVQGTSGYEQDFAYWASVAYAKKFDNFSFKAGLNFGYTTQSDAGNESMLGINPYIAANIAGFDLWADFLYGSIDGNDSYATSPFAFNFAVEYKFDIGEWGQIAPAFRFSYLDTDGRGVDTSAMKNVESAKDNGTTLYYDNTTSFYVGLNWYIIGNSVKLSAGYEYAMFNDCTNSAGSADADVSVLRTQLQLLF